MAEREQNGRVPTRGKQLEGTGRSRRATLNKGVNRRVELSDGSGFLKGNDIAAPLRWINGTPTIQEVRGEKQETETSARNHP